MADNHYRDEQHQTTTEQMPEQIEPLMKTAEVAKRLAVDIATVRMWARDGKLKGSATPSGRWRFSETDLQKFLAAGKKQKRMISRASKVVS